MFPFEKMKLPKKDSQNGVTEENVLVIFQSSCLSYIEKLTKFAFVAADHYNYGCLKDRSKKN